MADTPRKGDTIIAKDATQHVVTSYTARNVRAGVRSFRRADLELIDRDAGLWAEVRNG